MLRRATNKLPCLLLACCMAGMAVSRAVEPEVLTLDFSQTEPPVQIPSWTSSYAVRGGAISAGAWKVGTEAAVGHGQIDIILNPSAKPPALAVTLGFEDIPETDLSINLHNAAGEMIAVDLFGNLAESARAGRTDTFIVPLAKFPGVARISVRRIKGPAEVRGLVAFPVMVESPDDLTTAQKEEFARLLGEQLATSPDAGPLRPAIGRTQPAATSAILDDPSYPVRAWSGSLDASLAFAAECSGTCYRFFTNLYLTLFPQVDDAELVSFTSSNGVIQQILAGRSSYGLASMAPTEEESEGYRQKFGHPLIVVPVALDAVEVLVHPANQMASVSFETLRLVFAEDGNGTGYWDPESGLRGPILITGGSPGWGTSQLFSQRVLGGAGFRPELVALDVSYPEGVEEFVARNQNAIGFAQHRSRTMPVKVLPLSDKGPAVAVDARTVNDGTYPLTRNLYLLVATDQPASLPEGVRHFADLLLSREGQAVVAEAGSFPLSAQAVRAARQKLGLP